MTKAEKIEEFEQDVMRIIAYRGRIYSTDLIQIGSKLGLKGYEIRRFRRALKGVFLHKEAKWPGRWYLDWSEKTGC
ncbi:MAG: hypothetical protein ACP5O7_09045 [Phycisphaerae bacterium]